MAIIQDSASGRTAQVDARNRLKTFAVTRHEDKTAAFDGKYNSIYFVETPAAANDYFFYMINTGTTDICLTDIRIKSSVATDILIEEVTGTPTYVTGTDAQVTNRNLGSSLEPSITAKYDTDITTLNSQGVLFFISCDTAGEMFHLRTTGNIILPQGQAIALKRVEATGQITCLVSIAECDA